MYYQCSIGSSGRVGGGTKKHEIYVAAFGGHLFYDLFVQGRGGMAPSAPPWIRYCNEFQTRVTESFCEMHGGGKYSTMGNLKGKCSFIT